MNITDIIISPIITEKTNILKNNNLPKISFYVNKKSTKLQIKNAFFSIFNIIPLKVNTLLQKPKLTRLTKYTQKNYSKMTKIAYITISKENYLELEKTLKEEKQESK